MMTTARKSLKGMSTSLTAAQQDEGAYTPHQHPAQSRTTSFGCYTQYVSSSPSLQRLKKSESLLLLFLTLTKSIYLGISLTMFNILCDPLPLQGVTLERAFLAYHICAITFPVVAFSLSSELPPLTVLQLTASGSVCLI